MNALALETPRVSVARCYLLEARHEFLRLLRSPAFALPTSMVERTVTLTCDARVAWADTGWAAGPATSRVVASVSPSSRGIGDLA